MHQKKDLNLYSCQTFVQVMQRRLHRNDDEGNSMKYGSGRPDVVLVVVAVVVAERVNV
jgi:hypothetical protein